MILIIKFRRMCYTFSLGDKRHKINGKMCDAKKIYSKATKKKHALDNNNNNWSSGCNSSVSIILCDSSEFGAKTYENSFQYKWFENHIVNFAPSEAKAICQVWCETQAVVLFVSKLILFFFLCRSEVIDQLKYTYCWFGSINWTSLLLY